MYSPDKEEFEVKVELARDKLLPRGYSYCRCTEYHLGKTLSIIDNNNYYYNIECVLSGGEDRFYVLTPIDIILAQKTDANDHVDWLINKKQFQVNSIVYIHNNVIILGSDGFC